jgi:hypothetical protein
VPISPPTRCRYPIVIIRFDHPGLLQAHSPRLCRTPCGQGDYTRLRTIDFDIPSHRMLEIADAFFNGNDQQAVELFEDAILEYYGDGNIPGGGWVIEEFHHIDMSV